MSLEYYKCRRLLQNIVNNAIMGPDWCMGGKTDAYHVPLDDIQDAREFLEETNRKVTISKGEK